MLNFLDFRVGRNWVVAAIVEWNGIFQEFWFSGILGQPPDINQNFQHEFPETFCSIWFCTGISGNFGPMDRSHNLRGNFTVMVSFMSAVQINGENFKKISGQKRPNPKKEALLLSWEHDLESSESERFFACTRDRLLFKLVFLISPFLACSSATWKGNEIHLYEVHFTETLIIFSL